MKDAVFSVLAKNESASSLNERYRLAAEKAAEVMAERDLKDQSQKFDKDVKSYQIANQSDSNGAEERSAIGIKR